MDKDDIRIFFIYIDRNTGLLQPHLGSDYLINILKANDFKVSRLLSFPNQTFEDLVENLNCPSEKLYFGFTVYDANYVLVKHCIEVLKERLPFCKIFLGGPTVSYNYELIMRSNPSITACFLGESEESIVNYFNAILVNDYSSAINGVICRDREKNSHDVCFLNEEKLNTASLVFNDKSVIESYLVRYGKISLITSRGCPYSCSFCAFSLQSNYKVRYYEPLKILEQIKFISESIKDRKVLIAFEDDCFTSNKIHFNKILDGIIEMKCDHLEFECQTRADFLIEPDIVKMKKANFKRVDVSLESSSVDVLISCGKVKSRAAGEKFIEQVSNVISWCKKLGIDCYTSMICGLPYDDHNSLLNTYEFIKENSPTGYYWNNLKVFSGTKLFKEYLEKTIKDKYNNEEVFNSILCNRLTKENVSNYDTFNICRKYDDQAHLIRKSRVKADIFQYYTGIFTDPSNLICIDEKIDIVRFASDLVKLFSFDTRVLIRKITETKAMYYSVNLAELFSLAYYKNNSNKEIFHALRQVSTIIFLEKNFDFRGINVFNISSKGYLYLYNNSSEKQFVGQICDLHKKDLLKFPKIKVRKDEKILKFMEVLLNV